MPLVLERPPAGEATPTRLALLEVEEFFRLCRELPPNPSPEALDRLRFLGRFLQVMTGHPDFPEPQVAAAVAAKCAALDLQWRAATEPMPDAEADALLGRMFP